MWATCSLKAQQNTSEFTVTAKKQHQDLRRNEAECANKASDQTFPAMTFNKVLSVIYRKHITRFLHMRCTQSIKTKAALENMLNKINKTIIFAQWLLHK